MAEPIKFPEADFTWKGPTSDIGNLPSYREGSETISCWRLTEQEKEIINKTGEIWLHVWGLHPPVSVSGLCPFVREPSALKAQNDSTAEQTTE